jgi:hypothetical protein
VLVWLHVPVPEQNDGGWRVAPLHDAAVPHDRVVGCCSHAPLTQKPVLPHPVLAGQRASAVLFARFAHVPFPALHDWQVPQLAVEQQTPSTQLALTHSFATPQVAPFAFFELQVPAVVVLPVQYRLVLAHCASAVQLVRQALTPQM